MNITGIKYFSTALLVDKLRQVPMLKDRDVRPYTNTSIQVTDIEIDKLSPAQLYVLQREFEKVRKLRWLVIDKFGVDILRLADSYHSDQTLVKSRSEGTQLGYIELTIDNQTISVIPPVVEESIEANKSSHLIINDGMHRCFLALVSQVTPAVICVRNIPKQYPYYAYPLPNGWNDVKMITTLTDDVVKKYHRLPHPDYKKLYRDFDSVFVGCGGPRGTDVVKEDPKSVIERMKQNNK